MHKNFDYEDIRRQVLDFLHKLGIEPYDESEIILDGKLHRFRTRDDTSGEKSGAIIIHTDNCLLDIYRTGAKASKSIGSMTYPALMTNNVHTSTATSSEKNGRAGTQS